MDLSAPSVGANKSSVMEYRSNGKKLTEWPKIIVGNVRIVFIKLYIPFTALDY
jgi:hypothetical protein